MCIAGNCVGEVSRIKGDRHYIEMFSLEDYTSHQRILYIYVLLVGRWWVTPHGGILSAGVVVAGNITGSSINGTEIVKIQITTRSA